MAAIYDYETGSELTAGLQGCNTRAKGGAGPDTARVPPAPRGANKPAGSAFIVDAAWPKVTRGASMPDPAILTIPQTAAALSLSVRTLYRLISSGAFPRPMKLSAGRVGVRRRDLDAWLSARVGGVSK